ncbi:MAG TPA: ABC transporter substrate-binding protein [Solirubrobacterales bacterium]
MKLLATAIGSLLAVLALVACGGDDDGEPAQAEWEGETIEIGSLFSTTGPGAAFGPQQVDGAELAVDEVNEAGGVNGAELELTQRDDGGDPKRSADEMTKLVTGDEVLAVLGPTFSNSAAEADPIANEAGTPVLAVSNTGPGIVGDCPYPCDLVFRDSLGEAEAIPANVESFAGDSDARRATVIHPLDDPFGESTAGIAADALDENGIEVTATEVFAPLEAGPQPAIEAAIEARADAIFIAASSAEVAADAIEIARETGFEGEILGGNAFNSPVVGEKAGAASKGARSAAAWIAGNDSMVNTSFIGAYEEAYDTEPDQFAAQSYTGLKLLAAAAREADLGFDDVGADREAIAGALQRVELESPLGRFSFTADHDVSQPIWVVRMDGEGGYELVEELPPE